MGKTFTPLGSIRRARTMSQADLARLAGLSQQTIAAYEKERITPPAHVKVRLSVILGASVEELFPSTPQQVAS